MVTPEFTNLGDVLMWLTQYGAPMITMYLVAQLLEKWPVWNGLAKVWKFTLPMLFSVGVSILATWLLSVPGFIEQYGPYFAIVMSSVLAYLSSQKSHADTKKAKG